MTPGIPRRVNDTVLDDTMVDPPGPTVVGASAQADIPTVLSGCTTDDRDAAIVSRETLASCLNHQGGNEPLAELT